MNYQKLIIVGNATKDAERKTAKESDTVYTTFRVGVSDGKKDSVFFPVTVFGKQAEIVAQYVTKGMEVLVEGRIEAREDGRMNVVADRVVFGAQSQKGARRSRVTPRRRRRQTNCRVGEALLLTWVPWLADKTGAMGHAMLNQHDFRRPNPADAPAGCCACWCRFWDRT